MINDNGPKLNLPKMILASGSPRRSEILRAVGWEFEKIIPEVDESEIEAERPFDYVTRLAKTKARTIALGRAGDLVLGADTIVVVDEEIVGKPADRDQARIMIERLSGRWHDVLTGVAVVKGDYVQTGVQNTRVKFYPLSKSEIEYLVEFGDPLDKAGAYAVQAEAALFIERIDGDYWNVVGLPVSLVYRLALRLTGNP